MNPKHTLSFVDGRLVIQAERPARVLAQYKFPDEGGIYLGESAGDENAYWLPTKASEAFQRWKANPKNGSFTVLVEYGGFARVEIPKADLLAVT